MHKTTDEAAEFVKGLQEAVGDYQGTDVLVAPTSLCLDRVAQALAGASIHVAAQNIHAEAKGAFTGEISAPMLKAAGVTHSLVGHSERRKLFHETDEEVRAKVEALLAEGLKPIICLGETLEEREAGQTQTRVETQLRAACEGLSTTQMADVTIAYEPVWAIGTGKTATPKQAQEIHAFLRTKLAALFDTAVAEQTRILYGGSVKPANVKSLMAETDIDGALVGGASLQLDSFTQLVKFADLP